MSDFPRRCCTDRMTPAEKAITDAMIAVEEAGCDILLTEAVVLLQQAREKVADFVDRPVPAPPSSPDRCRCGAVTLWRNPSPNTYADDPLTKIRHTRIACAKETP